MCELFFCGYSFVFLYSWFKVVVRGSRVFGGLVVVGLGFGLVVEVRVVEF